MPDLRVFSSKNLSPDSGETKDLASSRPELMARAEKIFLESHRPDPKWPLDRLSEELNESRREAWEITNERRKAQWAPDHAKPLNH
jgi:arylsulfatase A